jgi:glycosyltransferase involved in cell wall biosynthesis
MRILWFQKDAPWLTSAYAKISDEVVLKRLKKHHNVALFCTVGAQFGCIDAEDVVIYTGLDGTGEDLFEQHYQHFKADIYVTAYDMWPLEKVPQAAAEGKIIWVPWCFVDFSPIQPFIIQKLNHAVKVVPTSKWLESELKKTGLQNVLPPIPMGINHEVFQPLIGTQDEGGEEITKERLKKTLEFEEDTWIIGMFQMNQLFRKPFDEQIEGIKIFHEENPDVKLGIYIHSLPRVADGWSLPELLSEYGLGRITRFADSYRLLLGLKGYPDNAMCKLYNTVDVVLNATYGESPGLPIMEAQACGTPVISTDFVCMPEFTKAGYTVKVLRYFKVPMLPMIRKAVPDPYDIADKLAKVCNSNPEYWRKIGPEAMKEYSWDRCLQEWLLALEDVEQAIESSCLKMPSPSKTLEALSQEIRVVT